MATRDVNEKNHQNVNTRTKSRTIQWALRIKAGINESGIESSTRATIVNHVALFFIRKIPHKTTSRSVKPESSGLSVAQSEVGEDAPASGGRVAILVKSFASGGSEKQAFLLAQSLVRAGCYPTVIALEPRGFRAKAASLQDEFPDVSVHVCLPRLSSMFLAAVRLTELFLKPLRKRAMKFLASIFPRLRNSDSRPQLLLDQFPRFRWLLLIRFYMENPLSFFSGIALRRIVVRRQISRLIIFGIENVPVGSITARKLGLPAVFSERNDVYGKPVSKTLSRFRETVYPEAELLTANTEFAVRELQQRFTSTRVLWLPNRRSFSDASCQDEFTRGRDIAAISRLVPQKRVLAVVEALALLPVGDYDTRLQVFGTGLDLPNLENAVRRNGLGERVRFHGYTRAAEIYNENKDLGFIVVNSEYEGSSNSLHEAVSNGLIPIVAGSVREIWEILSPSLHEVIITDGTPSGIASKLRLLLSRDFGLQTIRSQIYSDFHTYWARCDEQLFETGPVVAGGCLDLRGGHNVVVKH